MANTFLCLAGMGVFVSAIYAAGVLPLLALIRLLHQGWTDPWAWSILMVLVILTVTPLTWTDGPAPRKVIGSICASACSYFPIKVLLEDEDALKPGASYVLGYEPHSALPVGIPSVFSAPSPALPKFLQGGKFHSLASGVCFQVPFVRQLWQWLGMKPATREAIEEILGSGGSVLLNPGGVQECLHMSRGGELVFLRSRQGFVRMALQHGAALVPIFAFGQGKSYTWYRPGPPLISDKAVAWISRKAGAVPLLMHGRWMTPTPHQVPITIVVGRPIEVPQVADPPVALVEQYLQRFITEMQQLFDKHKAAAGYKEMQLKVM